MYYTTDVDSAAEAQAEIYRRYARIKASIAGKVNPAMVRAWRERVDEEALAAWSALAKCNLMRWEVVAPALLLSAIHHIQENTPDATPDILSDDPAPFRDTSWKCWLGENENHDVSRIDYGEDQWWIDMRAAPTPWSPDPLLALSDRRRRTRSDSLDDVELRSVKKRRENERVNGDEGPEVGDSTSNSPPLWHSGRIIESASALQTKNNTVDASESSGGELLGVYNPGCRHCRSRDERCEVMLRANSNPGACTSCQRRRVRCSAIGQECEVIPVDGSDTPRVSRSFVQGSVATALKHVENASSMTPVTNSLHHGNATALKHVEKKTSSTTSWTNSRRHDNTTVPTRVQNTSLTTSGTNSRHDDNSTVSKPVKTLSSVTSMTPSRHQGKTTGNMSLITSATQSRPQDKATGSTATRSRQRAEATENTSSVTQSPRQVNLVPASVHSSQDRTASGRTDTSHTELVGTAGVSSAKGKGKEKEIPSRGSLFVPPPSDSSPLISPLEPPFSSPLPTTPVASTEHLFQKISRLVAEEISSLRSAIKEATDHNAAVIDEMNKGMTKLQEEFRLSQVELEERIRIHAGAQATSRAAATTGAVATASASNKDAELIDQLLSEVTETRALLNQTSIENANLSDANQFLRRRLVQGGGQTPLSASQCRSTQGSSSRGN